MDMEAGKTLTNEEVIRELLELLKKNAMKEQANDVFEICSYVDGLEKKIDSMTEELTNMQNQIKEMQEYTLVNNAKKALSEAQERLNTRCEQIKSQVLEVKAQVKSTAKSIVDEAKAKGRSALYRVSEFLGIKKRLFDIRENVRSAIKTMDKDIAKTALLAKGFREAGQTVANTGLRHTRFGRNPRKAAQGILSALRTGRANPTSWKCRNSSLWSFGRWSAGTGIFSNGTSGTGSLTRYGTKPFTDGRCVCLRALMNAWLRKNGMKRSIRRLGAFQRYKGGVSCSTTSMSSIFTKSPLWSIAPLRQYRNLLRLQRRK